MPNLHPPHGTHLTEIISTDNGGLHSHTRVWQYYTRCFLQISVITEEIWDHDVLLLSITIVIMDNNEQS